MTIFIVDSAHMRKVTQQITPLFFIRMCSETCVAFIFKGFVKQKLNHIADVVPCHTAD